MFRSILNQKIGNLVNFLASRIDNLSLTRLLKLLYLLDETAVRETGAPITWLEYKVWKNGPVADEIYRELKFQERVAVDHHLVSLDDFITLDKRPSPYRQEREEVFIHPKGGYDFSGFSEYEIELLERIVTQYGRCNAKELVDIILHKKGTLWDEAVQKHDLKLNFELYQNTSTHTIDFSDLIGEDELLKLAAQSAFEALYFQKTLHEQTA